MINKIISKILPSRTNTPEKTLVITIYDEESKSYIYVDAYMEDCGICRLNPDVYSQGKIPKEEVQMIINHIIEYYRSK